MLPTRKPPPFPKLGLQEHDAQAEGWPVEILASELGSEGRQALARDAVDTSSTLGRGGIITASSWTEHIVWPGEPSCQWLDLQESWGEYQLGQKNQETQPVYVRWEGLKLIIEESAVFFAMEDPPCVWESWILHQKKQLI